MLLTVPLLLFGLLNAPAILTDERPCDKRTQNAVHG